MRRTDELGLIAAALTFGVYVFCIIGNAQPPTPFIGGVCLFWSCFIIVRLMCDRTVHKDWGLQTANLGEASLMAGVAFLVLATILMIYGAYAGTLRFPAHTLLSFGVYPFWGLIQQFIVLSIVVTSVERWEPWKKMPYLIPFVGALVFGAVHFYEWKLVVATAIMEYFMIAIFLRYRNLIPLGILHGWLGVLFHLWVLERDLGGELLFGG